MIFVQHFLISWSRQFYDPHRRSTALINHSRLYSTIHGPLSLTCAHAHSLTYTQIARKKIQWKKSTFPFQIKMGKKSLNCTATSNNPNPSLLHSWLMMVGERGRRRGKIVSMCWPWSSEWASPPWACASEDEAVWQKTEYSESTYLFDVWTFEVLQKGVRYVRLKTARAPGSSGDNILTFKTTTRFHHILRTKQMLILDSAISVFSFAATMFECQL